MANGFTHESPYNETKEWYTPPEIFDALGLGFDLDPCSPIGGPVPWVPAKKFYTVRDNGLAQNWDGLVWMNPPYGRDTPRWIRKLKAHGNGIALVFSRTDTRWFQSGVKDASVICFVSQRIRFMKPNGERGGSPGSGSVLIAYGEEAATAVMRSGLGLCARPIPC